MLYIALAVACLLLIFVNLCVRFAKNPWVSIPGGFASLIMLFGCVLSPAVFLQVCSLSVVFICWLFTKRESVVFLRLSLVATLIAFAIPAILAIKQVNEIKVVQNKYPFVSMAEKIPEPKKEKHLPILPQEVKDNLFVLEKNLDGESRRAGYEFSRLHQATVNEFINSPGFGISRRIGPEYMIQRLEEKGRNTQNPPPQPIAIAPSASDPVEMNWKNAVLEKEFLQNLHLGAVGNFSNPEGFGFAKSRQEVSGAKPHSFFEIPPQKGNYKVENICLVSLLLHEEPVVYMSSKLPSMKDIKEVPVRELDPWEKSALDRLYKGEEMVVGVVPGRIRMVGSLRNANQCQKCHGGERGDLLGAFTYHLGSITENPPSQN